MDKEKVIRTEERKSLLKRYKASKKSRFRKWSRQEKIILVSTTVIFAIYAITLIYPFVFTFLNALKTPTEFYSDPLGLPEEFQWQNFITALEIEFNGVTLGDMIWNSVWQTLLATVCGLVASTMMAYVTAKYNFKFLKVLYAIGIFSLVIPIIGSTPSMYNLLYTELFDVPGLTIADNPAFIWVIWFSGFGFAYLVLYSYFKTISWTYAEAAFIDGAGHFTVFIKIMVPQALPAISSVLIVNAIGFWNDYMTAYLYLPSYPNLALGLYELKNNVAYIPGEMPVYYALMLLSLLPIAVAFIVFQKAIMKNLSTGGLKG
ncbi:MAG: carbohydrate ABC transporter permease [Clostridia bacterium]|nr:carbohydrate ABC transporter permease [Clostridia bacterium]